MTTITTTAGLPRASAPTATDGRGSTAHLTPANLARAQRALVAKAIAEFAHERILEPVREGDGYVVEAPDRQARSIRSVPAS